MNNYYDLCFCILMYRNTTDIIDLLDSLRKKLNCTYKVILVDAFYSDEVSDKIKKLSEENNCDYIPIENKGYSYGNNIGMKFILDNYICKKIIVSNPDISVREFDDSILESNEFIIAPKIITSTGKNQNPYYKRYSALKEKCIYFAFKNNNKFLYYIIMAIQKIFKILTFWWQPKKVYAAHGAFIIFDSERLKKYLPLFDDNMFLFNEEIYLAFKVNHLGETIKYYKKLIVDHKEDGSMIGVNEFKLASESYVYYYEQGKKNILENK